MNRLLSSFLLAAPLALAACGGGSCPDEFPRVCAKKGCAEKVKALLAKDAALLAKHAGQGEYCLHLAADGPIAEAALAAGAELEQQAGTQQTPLGAAIERDRGEVVRVLMAKGAKVFDPNRIATQSAGWGKVSVMEAMLDNGAAVSDGMLLHAVLNDQAGAVEALLKRGANANAAMGSDMSVITIGPKSGGYGGPQDVSGKTALQLAKSDAVRDLLKKAGAN